MKNHIREFAKNFLRPFIPFSIRKRFVDYMHYTTTKKVFNTYIRKQNEKRFSIIEYEPHISDWRSLSGFDRHYFYHTAWAARVLRESEVTRHTDISSNLRFCGIVSAFLDVDFYEFHPADIRLSGLTVGKADLTHLPFADESIKSLSCMHVVEHIGLGRYGDNIDPDGDIKAMRELQRVVAPQGQLLFVVPVGRPRIVFNAQRVYSCEMITETFSRMTLKEFALIPDSRNGGLIRHADPGLVARQHNACGCFWFTA